MFGTNGLEITIAGAVGTDVTLSEVDGSCITNTSGNNYQMTVTYDMYQNSNTVTGTINVYNERKYDKTTTFGFTLSSDDFDFDPSGSVTFRKEANTSDFIKQQ